MTEAIKMRVWAATVLVIVIILTSLSGSVIGEKSGGYSVHLYIVAVSNVNGKLVGEYSVLNVTVVKSENGGHVYVEGFPLHDMTFSASAWVASLVACQILGVDFYQYNFYYSVSSKTYELEGPSAGAAMTIGAISAILKVQPRQDVVITGMIMPYGIIGPVGGVMEKIYGVKEAGARIFLVPYGENSTLLEERGKSLGIEVFGVMTIYQAVKYFLPEVIKPPSYVVLSKLNESYLKESYLSESLYLEKKFEEVNERAHQVFGGNYSKVLGSWLNDSKGDLEGAQREYACGNYYTALSKLFQANISLQASEYLIGYLKAENKPRYLGSLFQNVSRNVTYSMEEVSSWRDFMPLQEFMVLAAAQARAVEAKYYLELANETLGPPYRLPDSLTYLAFSNARCGTSIWWYRFPVNESSSQINVYSTSMNALREAEGIYAYAEKCGVVNVSSPLYSEIQEEISEAAKHNMIPALFSLSVKLEGQVMGDFVSYYWMAIQRENLAEEIVEYIRNVTSAKIYFLEKNGTFPLTPLAYFEYAEYLGSLGPNYLPLSANVYWEAYEIAKYFGSKVPPSIEKRGVYYPAMTSPENGISAEIFLFIGIIAGVLLGSLIFSAKEKGKREEGKGDISRKIIEIVLFILLFHN